MMLAPFQHRVKTHDEPFVSYVKDVVTNYGMSVKHGHHHIYQALPRLLTVWFDFSTYCLGITKQTKEARNFPLPKQYMAWYIFQF